MEKAAMAAAAWLWQGETGRRWLEYAGLFLCLAAASAEDIRTRRLPDGLLLGALLFALLRLPDWQGILLGLTAVPVPLLLTVLLYERLRGKTGLGGGDIKLTAVLGAHLGPERCLAALFFACLLGLAAAALAGRRREDALPFGPFLTVGGLLALTLPCCLPGVPKTVF